jgi:hypothetical protein
VNFALHLGLEHGVDETLRFDARETRKSFRHDRYTKMTATLSRPDVARMQMTLVDDLDLTRREFFAQLGFDLVPSFTHEISGDLPRSLPLASVKNV